MGRRIAAHERALRELGVDESVNPRLYENVRGPMLRLDDEELGRKRAEFPNAYVDEEHAVHDAGLLIAGPRLWEATLELAADLRAKPSLSPERILEVLAPTGWGPSSARRASRS